MLDFSGIVVLGVAQGAEWALVGAGVTLLLGITRILNFAHGQFVMFAAMAGVLLEPSIGFWPAAGAGLGIVAAVSVLMYVGAFQFTFEQELKALIVSLGVVLIADTVVTDQWGHQPRLAARPIDGAIAIGDVRITGPVLFGLGISLACCLLLHLLLTRTWMGTAFQAIGADRFAARTVGINERRIALYAFVVSAVLAAVAGVVEMTTGPVSPALGGRMLFLGFVVAIIGGLGNVNGALLGGFLYGVLAAIGDRYLDPAYTSAYGYVLIVAVLLWRPDGLLVRRSIRAEGA